MLVSLEGGGNGGGSAAGETARRPRIGRPSLRGSPQIETAGSIEVDSLGEGAADLLEPFDRPDGVHTHRRKINLGGDLHAELLQDARC
jgi:hypothetical protein